MPVPLTCRLQLMSHCSLSLRVGHWIGTRVPALLALAAAQSIIAMDHWDGAHWA